MTQHIANNHMDMCRFSGIHDVEYRKVAAALEHIQKRIADRSGNTATPGSCAASVDLMHVVNCPRNDVEA